MKWFRQILEYAPEVVGLGADVRQLVDSGYPKKVLRQVVEQLSKQDVHASTERMRIETALREELRELRRKVEDLERRLNAREVKA